MNDELRYKLQMMRISIREPTNVYCDNEAFVSNSSMAKSTLKKKHILVYYHKVCECYAKGAVHIAYEPTKMNFNRRCNVLEDQTYCLLREEVNCTYI